MEGRKMARRRKGKKMRSRVSTVEYAVSHSPATGVLVSGQILGRLK